MRRFVIALGLLVGAMGMATAQDAFGGWFTITHGKIRQKDGTYRNLAGLRIPYYVEPVGKTRDAVLRMRKGLALPDFRFEDSNPSDTLTQVYNNDRDQWYFSGVAENIMPSAIDDVEMHPLGVNAPWQQLKVGWGIPDRNSVFVVFGSFDNYTAASPAGTSAFSNLIVDSFGGPFTANPILFPQVPGDYVITFNIAAANIVCPDPEIYFFQQFRVGSHLGPFNGNWYMLFSGGGFPQIGNSLDRFWYDSDPLDGIYADEEIDVFSTEPSHNFQANFLLGIFTDTNVTNTDVPPSESQTLRGTLVSGTYLSTWSSNNQYHVFNSENKTADVYYPIGVVYKTFAPNTPVGLTVTVEAKTSDAGHLQRIALWDYSLGTWTVVSTTPTSTTDTITSYTAGINPGRFAQAGTGEMKLRVDYTALNGAISPFVASIDHVKWRVSSQ